MDIQERINIAARIADKEKFSSKGQVDAYIEYLRSKSGSLEPDKIALAYCYRPGGCHCLHVTVYVSWGERSMSSLQDKHLSVADFYSVERQVADRPHLNFKVAAWCTAIRLGQPEYEFDILMKTTARFRSMAEASKYIDIVFPSAILEPYWGCSYDIYASARGTAAIVLKVASRKSKDDYVLCKITHHIPADTLSAQLDNAATALEAGTVPNQGVVHIGVDLPAITIDDPITQPESNVFESKEQVEAHIAEISQKWFWDTDDVTLSSEIRDKDYGHQWVMTMQIEHTRTRIDDANSEPVLTSVDYDTPLANTRDAWCTAAAIRAAYATGVTIGKEKLRRAQAALAEFMAGQ